MFSATKNTVMKEVYYKGQPFTYEVINLDGNRTYRLYANGQLVEQVKEDDLDIRSRVTMILDEYYSLTSTQSTEDLSYLNKPIL
jgi:hypothetical protein